MSGLLEIALSNAVVATMLALLAAGIGRVCRRPALTHSLWLLVFLKLVTPPMIPVQTSWMIPAEMTEKEMPSETDATPGYGGKSPNPTLLMCGTEIADQASFNTLPHASPRSPQGSGTAGDLSDALLGNAELEKPRSGEWESALAVSPPLRFPVSHFLVSLWLAGSLLVFAWTIWHTYRFHRLLRFARPAPSEVQNQVQQLARRLGLKRCPVLHLLPGAVSPMIWTIGSAPRLLFPARLLERLDRDQRAALFVHELAHLARRDHWVRILELIVLGLYWWHPVVWWARRELHEAEEQCCDAWVVWALSGQSRAYALALLHTVDFFSHARPTLPLAASGIGQVPHLRRRLTMIMQERTPRSLTRAGGVAVLALGLLLPLTPVLGQYAPEKPKDAPSNKDERDQQIEALKKAIKILEEQKKAEKTKQDVKKAEHSDEVWNAQREFAALEKQVEGKRKELKDLEAKLAVAKQRLIKLTSKERDLKTIDLQSPIYTTIELQPYQLKDLQGQIYQTDTIKLQNFQPPSINLDPIYQLDAIKLQDFYPSIPQYQPAGQDKKTDLERKVEKLLKEVEELKRELQKQKQSNTPKKQQKDGQSVDPFQGEKKQGH
jgi:beta-lactamase regulating signal transducer with metallopeptidase domain